MKLPILLTKDPKLLQVGGAMIGNKQMLSKYIDITYKIPASQYVIAMNYLLKQNLTHNQFMAIAYHELGHYSLGHLSSDTKVSKIEQELQADIYSANKTSAIDIYNALKKLVLIYKEFTTNQAKDKPNEKELNLKISSFISNIEKQMQPRYNALENIIKQQGLNNVRQ